MYETVENLKQEYQKGKVEMKLSKTNKNDERLKREFRFEIEKL